MTLIIENFIFFWMAEFYLLAFNDLNHIIRLSNIHFSFVSNYGTESVQKTEKM